MGLAQLLVPFSGPSPRGPVWASSLPCGEQPLPWSKWRHAPSHKAGPHSSGNSVLTNTGLKLAPCQRWCCWKALQEKAWHWCGCEGHSPETRVGVSCWSVGKPPQTAHLQAATVSMRPRALWPLRFASGFGGHTTPRVTFSSPAKRAPRRRAQGCYSHPITSPSLPAPQPFPFPIHT